MEDSDDDFSEQDEPSGDVTDFDDDVRRALAHSDERTRRERGAATHADLDMVAAAPATPQPAQAPSKPTREQLRAARRRVPVTMYTTQWCTVCRQARSWFRQQGLGYREYDVDRDLAARQRQLQLNPRGSVPTLDIDGRVIVGFGAQSVLSAIDDSVRLHGYLIEEGR